MTNWPKPPNDTGIGVHFGAPLMSNVEYYLPLMKEMGIKWVVLANDSDELIGRAAARFLQEGIMPIARPNRKINRAQNWYALAHSCNSPYDQIYNEFGNPREWINDKRPDGYWDIAVKKWIDAAYSVVDAGCYPGLQIESPGDLNKMLLAMKEQGATDLWDKMWLSLHLYPPDKLHSTYPYVCTPTCIEHEFAPLGYKMYADICEKMMGLSPAYPPAYPPIIVTEWAWTDSMGTPEERAGWVKETYRWFKDGRDSYLPIPDYLFSFCWFLLFSPLFYGFSLTGNEKHLPIIEAVKSLMPFKRYSSGEDTGLPGQPDTTEYNRRVVSPWLTEDEALESLTMLQASGYGFQDWGLEGR